GRSRVRRILQAVGGVYETADELLATNEALTRRLEELQQAHERIQVQAELLDQQAARLALAHEIGTLIHGTLDLHTTLDRIAATPAQHTPARSVHVRIDTLLGSARLTAESAAGRDAEGESHPIAFPIAIRGADVGVLTLAADSADAAERLKADF